MLPLSMKTLSNSNSVTYIWASLHYYCSRYCGLDSVVRKKWLNVTQIYIIEILNDDNSLTIMSIVNQLLFDYLEFLVVLLHSFLLLETLILHLSWTRVWITFRKRWFTGEHNFWRNEELIQWINVFMHHTLLLNSIQDQ